MISFIRARITRSKEHLSSPHRNWISMDGFFYTELGPSMFHRILLNKYPVLLASQNHPAVIKPQEIGESIIHYGHNMLHITGT